MNLDILDNERGNLKAAALVSSLLVLPFVVLESVNRSSALRDLPVVLFGFMWMLGFAFVAILIPIPGRLRISNGSLPNVAGVLARVAALVLLGFVWVSVTADQMPCFLGVPNCD